MQLMWCGSFLVGLPRQAKILILLISDFSIVLFVTWLAFCLRYDQPVGLSEPIILTMVASIFISFPIFLTQGLYHAIYRYTGWFATILLIRSISVYAVIFFLVFSLIGVQGVPKSVGLIQPVLVFVAVGLSRLLAKYLLGKHPVRHKVSSRYVALIYGAGEAGRQLASGLMQGYEIKPVAYIDDDPFFWKRTINGLRVYPPDAIASLLKSNLGISDLLLAIPSASRARQKEILAALSNLPVRVRIVPGLVDLARGLVKVEDVRDVDVDDILGREPVEANEELLHENVKGKVVLVTGAGGSIGSELCRQVIARGPDALVLFELSEFALYEIERRLSSIAPSVLIVPVLGSVLDRNKISRVIRQFRVQTIYHAAAYKHVPMIETNPAAGVWNNVFGTLRLLEAACLGAVETFVLVSTDKAVRPTNVMGCSKRLAELVLQAKSLQEKENGVLTTKLTMVRFGNVLGSSGSVVPIFREQIKIGGPVTVTHPEIIRYFMTIPEAAQLVIQAGAMGEGGDVMVLNMGEPVRIADLAKRMIHFSGLSYKDESNPNGDIEIKYTGLRPGEKLYEELLIGGDALPTRHPQVMRAAEKAMSWDDLEPLLFELESAIKADNVQLIISVLKRAVPEFLHRIDD